MPDNSQITLQDLVNQRKVNHQNPSLLIQTQLDVLTDAVSIYIAQGTAGATPREVAEQLRKQMVGEFLQRILTQEEGGGSTFTPSDFPEA